MSRDGAGAGGVVPAVLAVASLDADDAADGVLEGRTEAVGGGAGADVAVGRGARGGMEVGPYLDLNNQVAAAGRLTALADVEAARLVEETISLGRLFVPVNDRARRGGLMGGVQLAEGVGMRGGAV